jgi:oligosaccharyltransferase complex subunit delta (ribophorin II)
MLLSLLSFSLFDSQLPSGKVLGLARFVLGIGIPGDAKDLFNQIDSLASLESNS